MSMFDTREVEPFIVGFFVLIALSVLLTTSDETELGHLMSLLGLVTLFLGTFSIFLERILFGEFKTKSEGSS